MHTEIIEISREDPDPEALEKAAAAIRAGKVVAIPTETLYVLAADPFSLKAVSSVFQAKGREMHRALPILVDSVQMAEAYAGPEPGDRFKALSDSFWPGPLTIIVPASSKLPLKVTGNSGRMAVRQTAEPTATRLIAALGTPIIATSANRSGRPTCKSGIEVFGEMDSSVDLILDGGAVAGAGATTVDITEFDWRVIREGAVSLESLEHCLRLLPD